jgi:hypothetical protein
MVIFCRYFLWLMMAVLTGCSHMDDTSTPHKPWTHLELGAGNYGQDGHTKKALRKTLLKALTKVTNTEGWWKQLPEKDPNPYDPAHQYAVLFQTLDQLVERKGSYGVFHINDLVPEYATYAASCLRDYAEKKHYESIVIQPVPGDYRKISPAQTLASYGFTHYDSVHLKNPEVSFFCYGMDGDQMLCDADSRRRGRETLQHLANLSSEGLYFFPVDVQDQFIPLEEKKEFINRGIFYQPTTVWNPVPYYFPQGGLFDFTYGRVYFIPAQHP